MSDWRVGNEVLRTDVENITLSIARENALAVGREINNDELGDTQ